MFGYCLGIRLDDGFNEVTCKLRDNCPYYTNTNLGVALSHPEKYQELDTYNSCNCKFYNEQWQQKTETCETSDMQTDGQLTLWSQDSWK